jgi:hypothetical protein
LKELNGRVDSVGCELLEKLDAIISNQSIQTGLLQQIVKGLSDPPVAFQVDIETFQSQGEKMKQLKGKLKISILDNGTAKGTLTPVDAAGLPTSLPAGFSIPAWVSSDPGVVVTPAADGMSAVVAPATPPVLVTGASITVTSKSADGTATLTGTTTDPINVIAGPAGSFQISVQ